MPKEMSLKEMFDGWNEQKVANFENPHCVNCSECCSAFSFITPQEFEGLLKFLLTTDEGKKIFEDGRKLFNSHLDKKIFYGMCLFADMTIHRCKIYDKRPQICKDFHCSEKLNKVDRNKIGLNGFRLMGQLFIPELPIILQSQFNDYNDRK